jgi:hypothetical protein
VKRIVLEPYASSSLTLVRQPLTIDDDEKVSAVVDLLRSAKPCEPNHPMPRWCVILRLGLSDRELGGELCDTNQGVVFSQSSHVTGGWHYGSVCEDRLGPVIEQLTTAAPALAGTARGVE